MVTNSEATNMEVLSIDQGEPKASDHEDHGVTSAHIIGQDSWQQVGLLLVTSFNCGYILSFSNLMLVPLGWTWGIIAMVFIGFCTFYSSWILAGFHFIDGKRFIRFRDLMGHVFGREMYHVTWIFQYAVLQLGNIGFILLGARGLKEIQLACSDSHIMLPYFVIITGFAYFVFAYFIPNMSAMRLWLGLSTVVTATYVTILLVIPIQDANKNPHRRYEITGSKVDKVFNAFGAVAAIVVSSAPGLLLEVQSTLKRPAVRNMRRALYLLYTVGIVIYYGMTIVGFWAYGTEVSWYLPNNLSGPKWAKILTNISVFIQSIITQNMFAAPIHETLDTTFLKLDEGAYSIENLKRRFIIRGVFFTVNSLIAAAFPFMGDIVNFVGSFALIPITYIFPSMLYLKLKGKTANIWKKILHWCTIILFGVLTVATTISAVRLFVLNFQVYKVFADV